MSHRDGPITGQPDLVPKDGALLYLADGVRSLAPRDVVLETESHDARRIVLSVERLAIKLWSGCRLQSPWN